MLQAYVGVLLEYQMAFFNVGVNSGCIFVQLTIPIPLLISMIFPSHLHSGKMKYGMQTQFGELIFLMLWAHYGIQHDFKLSFCRGNLKKKQTNLHFSVSCLPA